MCKTWVSDKNQNERSKGMNQKQFKEIKEAFKTLESMLAQGMPVEKVLQDKQFINAANIASEGGKELISLGRTQKSNWPAQMETVLGTIKGTMDKFAAGGSKKECQEHLEHAKNILRILNPSLEEQEKRMIRGLAMKSNRLI